MKISSLPGLTPDQVTRLHAAGLGTCERFLRASGRERQRQALQQATGLSAEILRDIKQQAELSQIRGVGPAALARLFDIGVTSMSMLAAQEPETLQLRLRASTEHIPNLAIIEDWILQARGESNNHSDVISHHCCPA